MKKLIITALILITFSLLLAVEPVALFMKSKGKVEIIRDKKSIKFKSGELLYDKDEIRTGGESYAALKYADGGATLKVFPNSVIMISAVQNDKQLDKNTSVKSGSLYSKIYNKIKGTFRVETPTTVASVKGTGFVTRLDNEGNTHIIVLEGEVLVENKDSGKSDSVTKGSTGTSYFDGEIRTEPTQEGEISEAEMKEIESVSLETQKSMKVQITDQDGNIKYIDITY